MKYDAVIIGAGPAGLSAAIYLRRAMLSVAVIEKQYFSGGQLLLTKEIENYPGIENVTGDELSEKFRSHAESLGTEFINGEVVSVKQGKVTLKNSTEIDAKAVVIAVGTAHKRLGVKGETEFSGRGVSYCAVCDGAFFADGETAVIGGGDTALEDALYLAKICKKVTLIHRRKELRASKILQNQFLSLDNAEFLPCEEVQEFKGDKLLNEILLKSGKSISVSGAFVAVGQAPQTDFVADIVETDNYGFIKADELCRTSAKGIFAIGDVIVKPCRQVVTAAADGAVVSRAVTEYINNLTDDF
ncbi:MAG: NAD(P)/FAD-dependent oxidoreductase [Eubacterium sp.]